MPKTSTKNTVVTEYTRTEVTKIQAVQWTGSNPLEVARLANAKVTTNLDGSLSIEFGEGKGVTIPAQSWLIKENDSLSVMLADSFAASGYKAERAPRAPKTETASQDEVVTAS